MCPLTNSRPKGRRGRQLVATNCLSFRPTNGLIAFRISLKGAMHLEGFFVDLEAFLVDIEEFLGDLQEFWVFRFWCRLEGLQGRNRAKYFNQETELSFIHFSVVLLPGILFSPYGKNNKYRIFQHECMIKEVTRNDVGWKGGRVSQNSHLSHD